MSEVNPRVAALTERALKKNPDLRSAELQAIAAKIDKSVTKLTGRQFHARYALQARRRLFGGSKKVARPSRARQAVSSRSDGPAVQMLDQSFDALKESLNQTLDASYKKAIAGNRLDEVGRFLLRIEETTSSFA